MAYANYEFYTNQFFGDSISGTDFPRLAMRASYFLDYYTMGKAKKNPDAQELKMACCAVAEQYKTIEAAKKAVSDSIGGAGVKKSETVGSYSVSYADGEENAKSVISDASTSLVNAARLYLAGTGLLYRGGCNVCAPCCDCL